MSNASGNWCRISEQQPRVVVAVSHLSMRAFIVELLAREHGAWRAVPAETLTELARLVTEGADLVVIDSADFGFCRDGPLRDFDLARVVIISPEPDAAYQRAALEHGAGEWVSRDCVSEELSVKLRSLLTYIHTPCPPTQDLAPASTTPADVDTTLSNISGPAPLDPTTPRS